MQLFLGLFIVIACIAAGRPAWGQDHETEIRSLIAGEASNLASQQFRLIEGPRIAVSARTTGPRIALQLQENITYALVAACDQTCSHIELSLYDKGGTLLTKSLDVNRVVIISGPAPHSGWFEAAVSVPGCVNQACTVTIALFQRDAEVQQKKGDPPKQAGPMEIAEPRGEYAVRNFTPGAQLNLRSEPNPMSGILMALDVGSRGLFATGDSRPYEDQLWIKVQVRGLTGWVNARFVHPVSAPDPASPGEDGSRKIPSGQKRASGGATLPSGGGPRCTNHETSCSAARNYCIRSCRDRHRSPRCSVECQQAFQLCISSGAWSTTYCQRTGLARK
jgi:hypothetical protein